MGFDGLPRFYFLLYGGKEFHFLRFLLISILAVRILKVFLIRVADFYENRCSRGNILLIRNLRTYVVISC